MRLLVKRMTGDIKVVEKICPFCLPIVGMDLAKHCCAAKPVQQDIDLRKAVKDFLDNPIGVNKEKMRELL